MPDELIENGPKIPMTLVEDASRPGALIVRGEFARAGVPTANRRIYGRRLWESNFQKLAEQIRNRTLTGELNHPRDGVANMFNTAHLITGLTMTPEGVVIGEAQVLEDLPGGKVVAAIYRAGGKVGVSSRGFGSTRVRDDGNEDVLEDYQLVTFDFVADPADVSAYPEIVNEESLYSQFFGPRAILGESSMPIDPKERLKVANEVRAELIEQLLAGTAGLPEDLRAALEKIQAKQKALFQATLAEGRKRIQEAVTDRDKAMADLEAATKMARAAGFALYLERTLGQRPDRPIIESAIGAVDRFASAKDFRAAVDEAVRAQEARLEEEAAAQRQAAASESRQRAEIDALQQENDRLRAIVERSLDLSGQLAVESYRADTLTYPINESAKRAIQHRHPSTRDEVDAILESHRAPQRTPDAVERARARARNAVGNGISRAPLHEERSSAPKEDDFFGLGSTWGELEALSGIQRN